jgi:transposase
LKEFKNPWTFDGICVADSALYTAENLSAMAGMKWITRVPLSIKKAQNKICNIKDSDWEDSQIKGYKIATRISEYANIKQRWLVIESEIRKQADLKKILKGVEKQLESAKATLRKLSIQNFARKSRCRSCNKKVIKLMEVSPNNRNQIPKKAS